MSKYELTISSKYVAHWGVVEAVREFFQNAIDESNLNPDHSMDWNYDKDNELLTISNKNCKLSINSLLLGNTTKDERSIGKFGEGYKVAIVVLLRNHKTITIHNGDELWNTRFVNSRRYKDYVPVIETSKFGVTGTDLIVEIGGIDESEFEEIKNSNLNLRKEEMLEMGEITETNSGDILLSSEETGNIYVEGLFINNCSGLKYGYNFKSDSVSLNRDRNIISQFDIEWNATKICAEALSPDDILEIIDSSEDYCDMRFAKTFVNENKASEIYKLFNKKYGNRIPVSTQEEADYVNSKGFTPIITRTEVTTLFSHYGYCDDIEDAYNVETSIYTSLKKIVQDIDCKVRHKDFDGIEDKIKDLNDLIEDFKDELIDIQVN